MDSAGSRDSAALADELPRPGAGRHQARRTASLVRTRARSDPPAPASAATAWSATGPAPSMHPADDGAAARPAEPAPTTPSRGTRRRRPPRQLVGRAWPTSPRTRPLAAAVVGRPGSVLSSAAGLVVTTGRRRLAGRRRTASPATGGSSRGYRRCSTGRSAGRRDSVRGRLPTVRRRPRRPSAARSDGAVGASGPAATEADPLTSGQYGADRCTEQAVPRVAGPSPRAPRRLQTNLSVVRVRLPA